MQQTVKMRFFLPVIRYREHQMAGWRRMTEVSLVLVCHSEEKHAMFHLTIYHSSSLWIQLVTSLGSLCVETRSFCLSPTMRSVTGGVWLSKYLSYLTDAEQQMDFCCDCSCLDLMRTQLTLGFYLSSAEKAQVQNGIDGVTDSSSTISITCMLGRRAAQRATKSLSVEEN